MSNLLGTYSDSFINMIIFLSKKMEKSLGNDMASIIYMIGSGILWFIMSIVSKIEMHEINIIQTQVFRGVSMIILSIEESECITILQKKLILIIHQLYLYI